MRLFTGLDLPAALVRELERLLDRLRPAARIHWSAPANLHITTRFIGEWPDQRLGEVQAALAGLPPFPALRLALRRVGFFPNANNPRVFWCGVEAPPELGALAAATEGALERLGMAREDRPFSPHLTLARIKERIPMQPLRDAIAALPSLDFGEFTADRFFLYRSQLRPGGSVYTKLAEFPLTQ
jgi:RNA 2',3'-cyclic 3'-phosphodiesterase